MLSNHQQHHSHPLPSALVRLLLILGVVANSSAFAQDLLERPSDDIGRAFPAADCQPRGTLFQWSYSDEPSGGPDLDEPIVTDRPDFTEASVTVGKGVLQVETGYTYSFDREGPDQTIGHSFPEALFRYGVFDDWLELRLATNVAGETFNSNTVVGMEDIYVGAKLGLTPQHGWLPEMALVPQMTVPTGHKAFTEEKVLPGVNWLYGWDINDFLATGGSTQFNSAIDGGTGKTYTEWAQSWTINYSLHDRVGAYTEWFAFFPHGADTELPQYYFDGGLTFLVNDDTQLDVRGGKGLNDAAADYFVGVGLSIRFH